MASLSEQVRARLREEMARKKLSQRDVANLIGWSQSKVAHQLTQRTEIKIDDLAALCFALDLSVTEAVRTPGLEFVADMTPSEFRIWERIHQLLPHERDALLTVLDLKKPKARTPDRGGPTLVKKAVKSR